MEAGDGPAGNRDEHHREYRVGLRVGLVVVELIPYLGDGRRVDEEHHQQAESHEEQRHTEDGVELADELVDGKERREHIISEDDYNPERAVEAVGSEHCQQVGGVVDEHGADENHQQQGEYAHYVLDARA